MTPRIGKRKRVTGYAQAVYVTVQEDGSRVYEAKLPNGTYERCDTVEAARDRAGNAAIEAARKVARDYVARLDEATVRQQLTELRYLAPRHPIFSSDWQPSEVAVY